MPTQASVGQLVADTEGILPFSSKLSLQDNVRMHQPLRSLSSHTDESFKLFYDTLEKCNRDCNGHGTWATCRTGATFAEQKAVPPPAGVNGVEPDTRRSRAYPVAKDGYRNAETGVACSLYAKGAGECTLACLSYAAQQLSTTNPEMFTYSMRGEVKADSIPTQLRGRA
eukprot:Rhum_TRINITY_DN10014_c0_g2::Rhum_TRINITY_DN10014_c0_g2_i1::g.36427::m.36427